MPSCIPLWWNVDNLHVIASANDCIILCVTVSFFACEGSSRYGGDLLILGSNCRRFVHCYIRARSHMHVTKTSVMQ